MDDELAHIGVLRKSGRYPWGSGDNPHQRNSSFLNEVDKLRKQGLSEVEIARGMGITTTQLRAAKAIAKNEKRKADISEASRLKEKGISNITIGEKMGINESSVRALLDPALKERNDILVTTADFLKKQVDEKSYLDIGAGAEHAIGISDSKLNTAVAMLKEDGYTVHYIQVDQLGTGNKTSIPVLAKPGVEWKEVYNHQGDIRAIQGWSDDGGRSYLGIEYPSSISSKRVAVKYGPDGGADADGVIYIRPGVDDVSLGSSRYAQVRIAVDGTHYLKGMAMYKDDLPDGVDLMFNTNKKNTGNKLDAMKALKDDKDNPFGAVISRQRKFKDGDGKEQLSPINIVNEEGNWHQWSRSLSSQMLSKQSPGLAKERLESAYKVKKDELDDILQLTNPTVKKKLLETYADGADSSAVSLKAAGLPRTRNHVILPFNDIKDGEIYAPNYNNGDRVALIRHPHGGKFEIPELTVNNRYPDAKRALGNAPDAVGINSRVASRLSGADFDGDTVLVIPNNSGKVKSSPPLQGLKNFDPQTEYPAYDGMRTIDGGTYSTAKRKAIFPDGVEPSGKAKQQQMGDVSNLITDMTIKGATNAELARAVRHSMVVIDAEKHSLNYKQSAKDHSIKELKTKYQGKSNAGASTVVSLASSVERVNERKARPAAEGGAVDKATGKKMYVETGASYTNKQGKVVLKTTKTTRMENTDDAFTLSSGTAMESIYATHANKLKALGNDARKTAVNTKPNSYSPTARKTYAPEVSALRAKLNVAEKNAPLERQAQILGNAVVSEKRRANPNLDKDQLKKLKGQALVEARRRTGAKKKVIEFEGREWEAVQAGAISPSMLSKILNNADLDQVKQLATPRANTVMTSARMTRARNMLSAGFTQAEVASALGVPVSTLNDAMIRGD